MSIILILNPVTGSTEGGWSDISLVQIQLWVHRADKLFRLPGVGDERIIQLIQRFSITWGLCIGSMMLVCTQHWFPLTRIYLLINSFNTTRAPHTLVTHLPRLVIIVWGNVDKLKKIDFLDLDRPKIVCTSGKPAKWTCWVNTLHCSSHRFAFLQLKLACLDKLCWWWWA